MKWIEVRFQISNRYNGMRRSQDIEGKAIFLELEWLEDLICVAEKRHFGRAADHRFVTPSALSRRIQSLELWIGAPLFDRAVHPITLTAAGEDLMETARQIVDRSYSAHARAQEYSKIDDNSVTIYSLHTLGLNVVPELIRKLQRNLGPFAASITLDAGAADEDLMALQAGTCDFFICYDHAAIPLDIEPAHYPSIEITKHHVRLYQIQSVDPPSKNVGNGRSADVMP